jgi:hypothetical protein
MTFSRFGYWTIVALALAAVPTGCSVFDDDDDDNRDSAQVESRSDLPDNADRVVQGSKGEDINWRATRDGTVYLMDRDSNKVIYSGSIRDGHPLEVDASAGEIKNNNLVVNRQVKENRRYNLYFLPD